MRPAFCLRTCVIALLVLLTACSPAAAPPPISTEPPVPTAVPPTVTIVPTKTSKPPQQPIKGKFDVGGYSLYLECDGVGSPTTVLDAGMGRDSTNWLTVFMMLESKTRVCAYDRAGQGQSDPPPQESRTTKDMVEDLHKLLAAAKEEGPYVLVGHSLAGFNVLLYGDKYPQEVAGLILLDSAAAGDPDIFLAVMPTPAPDENYNITRFRNGLTSTDPLPERFDWNASTAQVRAIKSLGDIPLIVVTADPAQRDFDVPDELNQKLAQAFLDAHKEYANLSTNDSLVIAPTALHNIQQATPQFVVDTVLKALEATRQK